MSCTITINKHPSPTVLNYEFDWSQWLAGLTILTSAWSVTVGSGLTVDSDSNTDNITTVYLSGGVAGTTYTIRNTITTSGSPALTEYHEFKIKVLA